MSFENLKSQKKCTPLLSGLISKIFYEQSFLMNLFVLHCLTELNTFLKDFNQPKMNYFTFILQCRNKRGLFAYSVYI